MIVVDSSVWIDFFNGVSTAEVERLDGLLGVTPLAIGDLILVEVMQGFRSEQDVATARQLFRSLALLPMLGGGNAWKAAENYRQLRRKGITVRKTIALLIATRCLDKDWWLLHNDRDFEPLREHLGLRTLDH